jgi:cation:H+ antiporter
MKALTLAVGDIIGGNTFDTLFIAMSDIAYRSGSIYRDVSSTEIFWLAMTMLMTGILLMGLLHRERHGIANIGMESFLVLVIYIGGLAYLFLA